MRSQGCTIQQALTPEAMAVVKQAVTLAKRRGHVQVTPLHVAHTMLVVSSGLFRAACLQAHSHPLQCRALELCFNVALNRLPTTTVSGPMLGPLSAHHHHPTIANALVAAFKRAQAHQRRGSIENQQQPLLAVKIELEQLIISILDDPSVSRVMKEAGFSSPLVKAKVEQAISTELGSQNQAQNNNNNNNNKKLKDSSNTCSSTPTNNNTNSCNSVLCMAQVGLKMEKVRASDQGGVRKEDIMSVIESLMDKRKRNRVVVGECVSTLEGLVRQVMDRVEKGEVPEGLKDVKFVPLSFPSFCHLSREEVEQKVMELKCLVKSCCVDNNKGVILYLDDLKWVNEFRANSNSNGNNILGDHQHPPRSFYCPIEHVIMEIGKLILGYAECGKLSLLGIATFQTYMRCRSGQSSLEAIWGLHAVTIPAGSLGLSLLPDSDVPSPSPSKKADMTGRSWLTLEDQSGGGGGGGFDSSRPSGAVNMEERSRQSSGCHSESTTSSLPSWLQQYKDKNSKRLVTNLNNDEQDSVPVKDLGKRWSSICTSSSHIYQPTPSFQRTPSFSSISPPSTSDNFYDQNYLKLHPTYQSLEPKNFWLSESLKKGNEPPFTMYIQANNKEHKQLDHPQQRQRHTTPFVSSSNPSSTTPTSTSSSDIMDQSESQCAPESFKEFNGDNLKALCSALEQKVPHQKDKIFEIVSTILQCRSGMATRKGSSNNHLFNKEETWLFFQGVDFDAKEKIARELARIIFGSQDKFVSIALSSFSSTRVEYYSEDCRNKRLRDEQSCSYIERFAKAVSSDPHRVFFIEDIDQVDYSSQVRIKKAIERGRIPSNGEDVSFGDAIIILSCESFRSRSRACSPSIKHKFHMVSPPHHHDHDHQKITTKGVDHCGASNLEENKTSASVISLDLNLSINDDNDDDIVNDVGNAIQGQSMDEIGLLASVDRCIALKY